MRDSELYCQLVDDRFVCCRAAAHDKHDLEVMGCLAVTNTAASGSPHGSDDAVNLSSSVRRTTGQLSRFLGIRARDAYAAVTCAERYPPTTQQR